MKKTKKLTSVALGCLIVATITLGGCSADSEAQESPIESEESTTRQEDQEKNDIVLQSIEVVGQVTEVLGNEIVIQVGTINRGEGGDGQSGERPINPEGGGGQSGGGRPSNPEGGGQNAGGARPNMPEGGGMSTQDFSEIIELSEETKTFMIPVGTAVSQFGTEMTFSQIQEEMYITIGLDQDGAVLTVNVLGYN